MINHYTTTTTTTNKTTTNITTTNTITTNITTTTGAGPLASCTANDGKWTTSIQASTTYTEVTIIDPLEFATLAGLIGGWLGKSRCWW